MQAKKPFWTVLIVLLMATGFVRPPAATSATLMVYDTTYSRMYLYLEADGTVYGRYEYDMGEVTGQMTGDLLLGWWREGGNAKECGPNNAWSGPIAYRFTDNLLAFTGDWGYCPETPQDLDATDGTWNGTSVETPPLPDLTGSWISLSSSDGYHLTGEFRIRNIGQAAAGPSKVRFYLSKNGVVLAAKPFKTVNILNSIEAGKGKRILIDRTFATSVTGKYVVAVIDQENQVIEANEANNRRVKKIGQ